MTCSDEEGDEGPGGGDMYADFFSDGHTADAGEDSEDGDGQRSKAKRRKGGRRGAVADDKVDSGDGEDGVEHDGWDGEQLFDTGEGREGGLGGRCWALSGFQTKQPLSLVPSPTRVQVHQLQPVCQVNTVPPCGKMCEVLQQDYISTWCHAPAALARQMAMKPMMPRWTTMMARSCRQTTRKTASRREAHPQPRSRSTSGGRRRWRRASRRWRRPTWRRRTGSCAARQKPVRPPAGRLACFGEDKGSVYERS